VLCRRTFLNGGQYTINNLSYTGRPVHCMVKVRSAPLRSTVGSFGAALAQWNARGARRCCVALRAVAAGGDRRVGPAAVLGGTR
jgi:hypothetical protein